MEKSLIHTLLLLAAAGCFVVQAFGGRRIAWWAAGVAFYLVSLAI
jgi:hypothetical protein